MENENKLTLLFTRYTADAVEL